jgi:hypothetical protein
LCFKPLLSAAPCSGQRPALLDLPSLIHLGGIVKGLQEQVVLRVFPIAVFRVPLHAGGKIAES